uniref:ganglioside-induced differentiation-associated protein 1 n=1 Tax=Myxine glutinosa TaxID=7769 RepID=UPI00358E1A09
MATLSPVSEMGVKLDEGATSQPRTKCEMMLYHWTQSYCSQKVRLAMAEKGLSCKEQDISLPLNEHNEPWFIRLNPSGEVPVLIYGSTVICNAAHIIDFLEETFQQEGLLQLIPDEDSPLHTRVLHYRELLDSLPVEAYTHGAILHPDFTTNSLIPAFASARIRNQILSTDAELKRLAQQHPELSHAYLSKLRRFKSSLLQQAEPSYLEKILDELEGVLDQVETELQIRNDETPDSENEVWLCGPMFSVADVTLVTLLHRLIFLGFSRRYWGTGRRPHLAQYYIRAARRPAFRRVLSRVNNILLSAVLPTAVRVAKRGAPTLARGFFAAAVLAGAVWLSVLYIRKRSLI